MNDGGITDERGMAELSGKNGEFERGFRKNARLIQARISINFSGFTDAPGHLRMKFSGFSHKNTFFMLEFPLVRKFLKKFLQIFLTCLPTEDADGEIESYHYSANIFIVNRFADFPYY